MKPDIKRLPSRTIVRLIAVWMNRLYLADKPVPSTMWAHYSERN